MLSHLSAEVNKVIVAPLNWGLGHATRSIPIIRALLSQNISVVLASDGEALELLRGEFPDLRYETLPAYKVTYKSEKLANIVLSNGINVARAIWNEKRTASRLVVKHKPDLIISDSRFGFRSNRVKSVIISHQLNLRSKSALLGLCLNASNKYFLNAFDEVWVPDAVGHKWSGALSVNGKIKGVRFIGPLSRFQGQEQVQIQVQPQIQEATQFDFDLLVILSGPEPARTKFESQIVQQLSESAKRICLVRGSNSLGVIKTNPNWKTLDRVDSDELLTLIHRSKNILSRSGYSSIIDYVALGRSAYLVPTPGQSEQEYLAEYLSGKEGFELVYSDQLGALKI